METKSPVENVTADEAKTQIAGMRSKDKLTAIVENDKRSTVQDAAMNRLAELDADEAKEPDKAPAAEADKPQGTIESGRDLTAEEVAALNWDREYPLLKLTGKQARGVIDMTDNPDYLEVIIHDDKRLSVVEAAKVRLRTTSKERAREEARAKAGIYRVEYNGMSGEYPARDEREAWALFNDQNKSSFSPKVPGRKITKVRSLTPDEMPPDMRAILGTPAPAALPEPLPAPKLEHAGKR